MLDEYARRLIESARIPSQLTGDSTRDFISKSYLNWLFHSVFSAQVADGAEGLSRLSLAVSILEDFGDEKAASSAFLVAESAEIAKRFITYTIDELTPQARFRKAVHYLDLASFFHLASYDANAGVVARQALDLLDVGNDFAVADIISAIQLSYYRTLAFFLRGEFGHCQDEISITIETQSSEDRAFSFLRSYLGELCSQYKGKAPNTIYEERIQSLFNVLRTESHPYSRLAAETSRLISTSSVVSRKSLYQLLRPIFTEERIYLDSCVSGDDNNGYPFAWPSTWKFCEEYFIQRKQHAVINVPTGAGKGVLAELAAAHALRDGWVLYLAPTNALCAQVKQNLKQRLGSITEVEAVFGNLEYTAELPKFTAPKQALVITPEKALLFLKREPALFEQCSLVVLDECHLLGSKHRGDIAEIVLSFSIAKNPEIRIILMSALVRDEDGDALAKWLQQRTGKLVSRVSLPWRPTRIARLTVLPDWDTHQTVREGKKEKHTISIRAFADTVTPWELETPLESYAVPIILEHSTVKFPWLNDVSRKLAELFAAKKQPTLLFVLKNRHHAFSIANKFQVTVDRRPEITQQEQDLYTLAAYELGAKSLIENLVTEKASAVHTSTMLNCEREVSVLAFQSDRALLLVATGTLSQGLNLPAEAVIVAGTQLPAYGDGVDIDPQELQRGSLNQVLNAAGRAARANIACRGASIVVPDRLIYDVNQNTSKRSLMNMVGVLELKDAALDVDSPLRPRLEAVSLEPPQAPITEDDYTLLARLPFDSEHIRLTIHNAFGIQQLDEGAAGRIASRLEAVKVQAIDLGYDDWILRSASLAGVNFRLAGNLKEYIESQAGHPDFAPPEDTYQGWAAFLIEWLSSLPATDTWSILRLHIKVWRYYWGNNKDPDLIPQLEKAKYPHEVSPEALALIKPIWENLQSSVREWLNGKTLIEISEILTRRLRRKDSESKRTAAGNYIPRALLWQQRVIEPLSLFAGLLLAVQNQWVENAPNSTPKWFAHTAALHTFPLGLRFGVKNPLALAWHRHIIQERRAANLLQELAPLEVETVIELQEAWQYTKRAREKFLRTRYRDDVSEIIPALQRILRTK